MKEKPKIVASGPHYFFKYLYDLPLIVKFTIAIIWDSLDFTILRIPGIGTVADFIGGLLGVALWRKAGILDFWEILDITDQIDAEIPSLLISGIISYFVK